MGCEKEYTLNSEINAQINEMLPASNFEQKIESSSSESLRFSWNRVNAKDGGVILYEVWFDSEDGDFTNPVYTVLSDNKGTQNELSVDQKTLNRIASAAGIAALAKGKVKWTVVANKGINTQIAEITNLLALERPMGFAEFPERLYLVGSATESGEDPSDAVLFKQVEEGVYEVYTALRPGDYQFRDGFDETYKTYFIDANNALAEGEGTASIDTEELVRLTLDFNTSQHRIDRIEQFGVFMPAYNALIGTMNYSSKGIWIGEDIKVDFFPFDWGNDERYKFEIVTDKGTEYMGSANVNNNSPVSVPASYFFLFPVTDSPWDNTYKFHPDVDGKLITAQVSLNADADYTHEIKLSN